MLFVPVLGFLFGFIGSMPIAGPIAVLVFAAAVDGKPRSALWIGLGCALAEGSYATLAFWGFSTFLTEYPAIVPISRALAAVILIALGISFVRRRTRTATEDGESRAGVARSFGLGFSITALNPTLIATWAAATTVLFSSGMATLNPGQSVAFGGGAALGIGSWYVVLVALVKRFGGRFQRETLDKVIRVMGLFLVGVGVWFGWLFGSYMLTSPS